MSKKVSDKEINRNTKIFIMLFLLLVFMYVFLILYSLGCCFNKFQLFNIPYDINSSLFVFAIILFIFLTFSFILICFITFKTKKILRGSKIGSIVEYVSKFCVVNSFVFMLLFIICNSFLHKYSDNIYTSVCLMLFSTSFLFICLILFLLQISESGGVPRAQNIKYKIKYHSYNSFKKYISDKLGIDVKDFKRFEEVNCDLEYYSYSMNDDIYSFVLIPIGKMNRKVFENYYEEGFANFFDNEFKDIEIGKKSFYVYYIFVVDEPNKAFLEMINSCTPMQDRYYFLGIGLDIINKELYITGYNKKRCKDKYEILYNKFHEIICDIIL